MTSQRLLPLCLALLSLPAVAEDAAPEQEKQRPTAAIATLRRAPKLDGRLKDLAAGTALFPKGTLDGVEARVGLHRSTLYLGVQVPDAKVTSGDQVTVTLFFSGAGVAAHGHTFRFGSDGERASIDPLTPSHAQEPVTAVTRADEKGWTVEAALPARSFPRFPARGTLVLDVCVQVEDVDAPGAASGKHSNCKDDGAMFTALTFPAEPLVRALGLKPIEDVRVLEPRANGWAGYGLLHYPSWALGDAKLDVESLRALVVDRPLDPEEVRLGVPPTLRLPDGRPLLSVVSGKDPFAVEGQCDREDELRLALYLVKGRNADRVLEWPAATCAFGRASSVDLDEDGTLTIGYSNGATVTFVWSKDHFDRTEIGSR